LIGFLLVGIAAYLAGWNLPEKIYEHLNPPASPPEPQKTSKKLDDEKKNTKLYTPEELALYDGKDKKSIIKLAVLGTVFDVSKGIKHYGSGGGYSFFSGKDASRAYVTGDFTAKGLVDDIEGLTPKEIKEVWKWLEFYRKDYKEVGKLIGRFYDENGQPTAIWEHINQSLKQAEAQEQEEEKEKTKYPICNSRWAKDEGGEVWCSQDGIKDPKDPFVPRQMFSTATKSKRCACVQFSETLANEKKYGMYNDCSPEQTRCKTS